MRLSLDALRVIESIHRHGSFAAAAQELHRVRSALTYTVKKLENDLGAILFDRAEHRAKLTPIGNMLLQEGRQLLRMAEEIEQKVKWMQKGWEEELFIAIDDTISISRLYPLIETFYQACSCTKLNITSEILSGCWDALTSGRVDLAIGVSGEVPLGREYGLFPLGQLSFVFAIAPHHPLAQLPEPLKNVDIIPYRAVVAADSSRKLPLRSSGILLGQDTLTVSSIQAKIQAHILGLGVGYLPLHLIQEHIQTQRLIIKEVEKTKGRGNFSVAWRLKNQGKALAWFLQALKDPSLTKLF